MSGENDRGAGRGKVGWLRRLWRLLTGVLDALDMLALIGITLAFVVGLVLMAFRAC